MKSILFTCFLALMLFSCNKKDPSLIAWYNFDSVENGLVKDLSGNHLDAVSHEAMFSEGKSGKSFHGDGKGYLEVKYTSLMENFKDGITIAAWVNRDTSSSWNCIITRETKDNWSEYFDLGVFQNKPLFSVDPDGGNFIKTEYNLDLPTGKWIHLSGTFDNKTYKLFIDGKEVASGVKEMKFNFTDKNPWLIGSNTNDQGKSMHDFFFGEIDDLKIYNRALTAEEILELAK
ncbi:MAG: LamG domain-containing protein [Bacteroidales bacterium]